MTGVLVDRKHTGQARTQWPWPEAEDTLGLTCGPPGRAACRHHLPAPPGAGSCRERELRVGPEPCPGRPAPGPDLRGYVLLWPPRSHTLRSLCCHPGSPGQGRGPGQSSHRRLAGGPLGLAGPRPRGCRKAQGGLQGSGPRPASAVVLTAVPTLSPHWPPGTPLPGSNEAGSITCRPEAPSRDPEACWAGGPARPSDARAEGKGRPGFREVPWPVASMQLSHLCDLGTCSRHLSVRQTGWRSHRPAQAPVPTHQHLREHQGSQRPAVHSRVPDQHVQSLGLCEAGHIQHHSTCGRWAVSTGQPSPGCLCGVGRPPLGESVFEDSRTQGQDTGDGCEAARKP